MHADTREKGMVRCEKRISTEEEAAAGTRKGRRKGGAHRARERAQMPEMRENRTGTHQVSFRARAQQSTIHATRPVRKLGASRPGGAEARRMGAARSRSHRAGGRPSTRTRTLLPHAVRVAVAAEARGGAAPGSTHLFFGVTELTPPGRPIAADARALRASALLPRSRDCGASALLPRSRDTAELPAP